MEKKNRKKRMNWLFRTNVIHYILLTIISVLMSFPFYWMVVMALKSSEEYSVYPPTIYPARINIDNFVKVIERTDYLLYFRNTLVCATLETLIVLIITISFAYGYYKLKNKSKKKWLYLLLGLNVVPFEIVMVYNYKTMIEWELIDNLLAQILPFLCNVTYSFIVINALESIPDSIVKAAKLDRVKETNFLIKIALPYVKNTLAYITVLNVVGAWNSFTWPLLVSNTNNVRTLPIAIYSFVPEYGMRMELVMAMSVLTELPMIILFVLFQKYIKKQKR